MSDFEMISVMLSMMMIIVTILISWIRDESTKKITATLARLRLFCN